MRILDSLRFAVLVQFILTSIGYAIAYDFQADGLYYNINPDGVTATVTFDYFGSKCYSGDIVIPPSVQYGNGHFLVTGIGSNAFRECNGLKSITIGDNVTDINGYAFYNCFNLESVTLGNSVRMIDNFAFFGCTALTSLELPQSLNKIGESALRACVSLSGKLTFPDQLTSIGSLALAGCTTLESIEIPASVTAIGSGAFQSCSALSSVTINRDESILTIGRNAFLYCNSIYVVHTTDVKNWCKILFETYTSNPVHKSHHLVANGERVMSVTSIEGLERIEKYAFFSNWDIAEIEIPSSVKEIGDSAFCNCWKLNDVTSKATEAIAIGNVFDDSAFRRCVLAVPTGSAANYAQQPSWNMFSTIVELDFKGPVGDINNDGAVDSSDVSALLECILSGGSNNYDLNGDNACDSSDLAVLLEIVLSRSESTLSPEAIAHWNELPPLRVLTLGNSYTDCVLASFRDLRKSFGLKTNGLMIYGIYLGYASLEDYINLFETNEAVSNGRIYHYEGNPEEWKPTTLRDVLSAHWDIITLQQRSTLAADYSSYEPYLSQLIDSIHAICPNKDVKLGWELDWGTFPMNDTDPGLTNWENKVNACQQMLANTPGISFVIPVGTAVQNARTIGVNNDRFLTSDALHVCYGVGQYAVACAWWESIIYPWSGISIVGNNYTCRITPYQAQKSLYHDIPVTERNNIVIQQCAKEAVNNPYTLSGETIRATLQEQYHVTDIPSLFPME